MSLYFDHTLHYLGRNNFKPNILVIGAMDGNSFDDMAGYIRMYHWNGIFVEPIDYQFNKLKKYYLTLNYLPDNIYENSAISTFDGELEMLTIDIDAINSGVIHPCFGGMSAVYPPKNGLASEGDAEVVKNFGKKIRVPCITLASLLKKHNIRHLDIIQLDTEGHDWEILKQLDLSLYRPKLIRAEWINLTKDEQTTLLDYFTQRGYLHELYGQDIDLVDQNFWQLAYK